MKPLRVILIDENPNRSAELEKALRASGHEVVTDLAGVDLLSRIDQIQPDLVLIDMASPDRDTLEHLRGLRQDHDKPIVLFAERSDGSTIEAALRAGVSAYVVDAVNPQLLQSIMQVAITQFREFQALREELEQTRTRLAERKLVDKAKGLLMKHRQLSEEDAYRSLRKLAMDRNQRIGKVAGDVISVLELLGG